MKKVFKTAICLVLAFILCLPAGVFISGNAEEVLIPNTDKNEYADRLVILLDTSASMRGMEDFVSRALCNTFVTGYGANKTNSLLTTLILFSENCHVFDEVDLGTQEGRAAYEANLLGAVQNKIDNYTCWDGSTLIGKAMELAYKTLQGAKGKRTVLLFSDGGVYNYYPNKAAEDEQLALKIGYMCAQQNITLFTCGLDTEGGEESFTYKCNGCLYTQREFLGALAGTAQVEYNSKGKDISLESGVYNKFSIVNGDSYTVTRTTEAAARCETKHSLLTPNLEGMASFFSGLLSHFNIDTSSEVIQSDKSNTQSYSFNVEGAELFLSSVELIIACSAAEISTAAGNKPIKVTGVKAPDGTDITARVGFESPNSKTLRIIINKGLADGVYTVDISNSHTDDVLLSISKIYSYDFFLSATADSRYRFGDEVSVKAALYRGDGALQIIAPAVFDACTVTVDRLSYSASADSPITRVRDYEGKELDTDTENRVFVLPFTNLSPGIYNLTVKCVYTQEESRLIRTASVVFEVAAPVIEVKAPSDKLFCGYSADIHLTVYKDEAKTQTASLPDGAKAFCTVGDSAVQIPVSDFKDGKYTFQTDKLTQSGTVPVVFTLSFDDPGGVYADVIKLQESTAITAEGAVYGIKAQSTALYYNTPLELILGAYTSSDMDEAVSDGTDATGECRVVITKDGNAVYTKSIAASDICKAKGSYKLTVKGALSTVGDYQVQLYYGTQAVSSLEVKVLPYSLSFSYPDIKHTMDKGDTFSKEISLDGCFTASSVKAEDYISAYKVERVESEEGKSLSADMIGRTLNLTAKDFDNYTVYVSYIGADGSTGEIALRLILQERDRTWLIIAIIAVAVTLIAVAAVLFLLFYKGKVPSGISFTVKANGKQYPVFIFRDSFPQNKVTLYDVLTRYPCYNDADKRELQEFAKSLTDEKGKNPASEIVFKGQFGNRVHVIKDGKSTAYTLKSARFDKSNVKTHTVYINGKTIAINISKN